MSYTNGESLILTRIRTHANFDANNSARNDWSILNNGKSDHYTIVKKLEDLAPIIWPSIAIYHVTWTTVIEVWQRNQNDDDQAAADCQGHVNDVIGVIQNKPRLGDTTDTIIDSSIRSVGGPVAAWLSDGGPVWAKMEVYLEWIEEQEVTFT